MRPVRGLAAARAVVIVVGLGSGACAAPGATARQAVGTERGILAVGRPAGITDDVGSNRERSTPGAVSRAAADATATVFTTPADPFGGSSLVAAILAAQSAPLSQESGEFAGGGEVVSTAPRILSENQAVGPYGQPEWTTRRRWARTRTYVINQGQIEFEQWVRGTFDDGEKGSYLGQTEVSFGLPHRLQFDLYANTQHEDGTTTWVGLQPEMRWAFADWGVLPLNPTLYLEYKWNHHEADVLESKLLLADEITPKLHWGMNLSIEQELDGEHACELAVTQALSWTLADREFSVGVEFEYDHVTVRGARDDPEHEFYLGPSFQWRPTESTHLDIVPLFGMRDAHDFRLFVVFGIDFGGGEKGPVGPVSSRSR